MIKFFLILFFITLKVNAAEFMISGGPSYVFANILGQEDVPTYKGKGYFLEAEYLIPFSKTSAFSLFTIYQNNQLKNTLEDNIQENLKTNYFGLGLKVYFSSTYVSASLGKLNFSDSVSGDVNKDITCKCQATEIGVGHRFRVSNNLGIVLSFNALHSKLTPSEGEGFEQKYDYWQYRASIALNFTLPSSPADNKRF